MTVPSPYTVKGLCFGQGRPKLCVPLVGRDLPGLLAQARELARLPLDLAEWRVDLFEPHRDAGAVLEALGQLRAILGQRPLLFTFRSESEGGGAPLPFAQYCALNLAVAQSGLAELVDLELFSTDPEDLRTLIQQLHELGVGVVVSSHDFGKTPRQEELVRRLMLARSLGADLPKVAVMPHSEEDVLTLLGATLQANRQGAGPLITMSMGPLGGVSRLCGEVFGSALTFGCGPQASAPGQFPAADLDGVLELVHQSL